MTFHEFVIFAIALFCIHQNLDALPTTTVSSRDNEVRVRNETSEGIPTKTESVEDVIDATAERFEKRLKGLFKNGVRAVMSRMMTQDREMPQLSPKCIKAFMKFIADLTAVKMWALRMLDATSKLPAGVFDGTLTDYGSFDECLAISVPLRNGSENFRGSYCAVEARPYLPLIPKNFSLARQQRAKPTDTVGTDFRLAINFFHYAQYHFGVCVPSSCTVDDMKELVGTVVNASIMKVHVPKCYVKESVKLDAIHIAVICVLAVLLILAVSGTAVEHTGKSKSNGAWKILSAFSLANNSRRLFTTSKSNGHLRALHGIRALSMAWVILGHTYVWTSLDRASHMSIMPVWFNNIEFNAVLNGWLSVEMFFFLSGLLTCHVTLQILEKTKGRLNIPLFIIHRYIRLTPALLLTMGLLFFLPLISSGPFWHQRVDPELEACRNSWWTNLLYIANWTPISKICLHPVWYLCADFQMYILSPMVLLVLYRSSFFGMITLALVTMACNVVTGALTYSLELPPAILIATGNLHKISREIDLIHIRTFSHVGPYCIGMATGYLILRKHKKLQLKVWHKMLGWSASIVLSICSVYGLHQWNTGYFHGPLLTTLYAAMHRTTFTLGAAWVTFACVSGFGGPVNQILSLNAWTPLSKLTYMAYLMHGLVIWTRYGSIRERLYLSHYNLVYEYVSNVAIVVVVSLPFYLLVEAPLNNIQHMLFANRSQSTKENMEKKKNLGHSEESSSYPTSQSDSTPRSVQLTSITSLPLGDNRNGNSRHIVNIK